MEKTIKVIVELTVETKETNITGEKFVRMAIAEHFDEALNDYGMDIKNLKVTSE